MQKIELKPSINLFLCMPKLKEVYVLVVKGPDILIYRKYSLGGWVRQNLT